MNYNKLELKSNCISFKHINSFHPLFSKVPTKPLLWQHSEEQRLGGLFFLRKLVSPFLHQTLQRVGVLFHDRQHVVEDIGAPKSSKLKFF